MAFISGKGLREAIQAIERKRRWHCAVAFWGVGAEALLSDIEHANVKIICNLRSGGTNPYVLERFPRDYIRQCNSLHAKVYLGDNEAVVGSANASANGLGFEGQEQETWLEAGYRIADIIDIILWFNNLWDNESNEITDDDLEEAKRQWALRQRVKPTLHSFLEFEPRSKMFPLFYWDGTSKWKPNKEAIVQQFGHCDDSVLERIDTGVQILDPQDRAVLKQGTWILCGKMTKAGTLNTREPFIWTCLGPVVDDAIRIAGEERFEPVALAAEHQPPVPFDADDPLFVNIFRQLILTSKYDPLRDREKIPWFLPRQQLMKEFWVDLQRIYAESNAA